MMRTFTAALCSTLVASALAGSTSAQEPAPGFRLFGDSDSTNVLLLDINNNVVHEWNTSFRPKSLRLLDDGSLLRSIRAGGGGGGGGGGGLSGGIQRHAFDGTLLWDWRYNVPGVEIHHDIAPLPNGNVLMIAWEDKTSAEAIAAGHDPQTVVPVVMPDHILEVRPTGLTTGDIVWEWHAWDHLIQDQDATQDNYGVVADNPGRVNINYPPNVAPDGDWLHMNGIDYDPIHDRIIVSSPRMNEIWVIDHSTTTAEAAGSTGGTWGAGGDLLYRWGNPAAHDSGSVADQMLFGQHAPNFIPPGLPGEGNVVVFNNGNPGLGSAVWELTLPTDSSGAFLPPVAGVYGPSGPVWSYSDPAFYSGFISSARRLPNGNTLICSGAQSWLFEVTIDGDLVWEYDHGGPTIFHAMYVDRTLWADDTTLSLAVGGSIGFDLVAGTPRTGDLYLVFGSASGTSPGIPVGGFTLPLNFDAMFNFSISAAGSAIFPQTFGSIDADGLSAAGFVLPAGLPASLAGLELDFAFCTKDSSPAFTSASNSVHLTLEP